MDAFIGTILVWPMSWAPVYWSQCSGATLQVSQNQALYSLLGNVYGGSGNVSFGLPDLRCRSPIGFNTIPSVGPIATLGASLGVATVTLGLANLPAHSHPASFSPAMGTQTVTIPAVSAAGSLSVSVGGTVNTTAAGSGKPNAGANVYLGGVAADTVGGDTAVFTGPYDTTKAATTANLQGLSGSVTPSANYTPGSPAANVNINAVTGGAVSVGPGGGVTAPMGFNNYQPSLSLNFIICLSGLYPMRP